MPDLVRTTLSAAEPPLVLALDVGSTGIRGGLYDARGREVRDARHKVAHALAEEADGASTIDPDQVVTEICEILTRVSADADKGAIAGVAIDTFASSLVGVDTTGKAITPCFTYADSRCAEQVVDLRGRLDQAEIQRRTGTRIHSSYLAPRLRWLRATDRQLFDRVDRWMSLSEYVHLRLLGVAVAGTPVAAWSGLLNRRTGEWDTQMVRLSGISRSQLSPVQDPSVPVVPTQQARRKIAQVWPTLKDAAWFPGVADGLVASIGTGGWTSSTAVVSAATSGAIRVLVDGIPEHLPPGLWCYRIDAGRSLIGGALNDVGRAISWVRDTFRLPDDDELDAAIRAEPVATTPLVLPFLTGERSTGWSVDARASILGLVAAHTPTDVARGVVEGLALSYARVARQMWELAGTPEEIRISGGVLQGVPAFPQVLADVLGAPVTTVASKRATLRGTALLALESVAPGVERSPVPTRERFEPVPRRTAHYAERLAHLEEAYAAITPL